MEISEAEGEKIISEFKSAVSNETGREIIKSLSKRLSAQQAEIERLRRVEEKARSYYEAMTAHIERPTYMGSQYAMAVCWRGLAEALAGGEGENGNLM